jgi:hypothetical protein
MSDNMVWVDGERDIYICMSGHLLGCWGAPRDSSVINPAGYISDPDMSRHTYIYISLSIHPHHVVHPNLHGHWQIYMSDNMVWVDGERDIYICMSGHVGGYISDPDMSRHTYIYISLSIHPHHVVRHIYLPVTGLGK